MLEIPHLPPVAQAIITITGVVIAVVRLLTASRPFWAAFPAWLQKGMPAALVAIGTIPLAIERADSWLDIVVAVMIAGATYFTASRGDSRPPEDTDGGPRINRSNTDPRITPEEMLERVSNEPPFAAIAGLAMVLVVGCDPHNPPCDESKMRAADAAYVTRVTAVCLPKYSTKEECPEYLGLQADHRAELKAICPQ